MLDFLRKRKRSWIITLLLGLIIIVFVAFYGGTKYQDSGVSHVASVNGEIITQREFALRYQRELNRYRELFKGSLTPEMLKNLNLEALLLDDMINRKLVLQEAHRLGITVTDRELAEAIAKAPDFQLDGAFNKSHYLQLLSANRITPAEFEDEQRESLTLQRLYQVLFDSVRVSDAELEARYRMMREKINLQFIRLPLKDFTASAQVTDEEIRKYYEQNQASLKEPAKVQVEYLAYPYVKFAAGIKVTEQEIEQYYNENREAKFRKPREAKLSYISLRVVPEAPAEKKAAVKARAERIVAEARAGKDFEQLIKEVSADATAGGGGDAGWVTEGQFPEPLNKTIFSMAKNQVSDPVDAPGGLQILKVEDLREGKTLSVKEATPEITQILTAQKAKKNAGTAAERDHEKALSGIEFSQLERESGAALGTTRLFTSGETLSEIGDVPEFYKSAFALEPKAVSPIISANDAYYMLRLKQKKDAAVPPLEEVRQKIRQNLIDTKAQDAMMGKANALLEQLRKEKTIARVAEQNSLKVEETGLFARSATEIPKIGNLPELARGIPVSAQNPVADKVYRQNDTAYVIAFKAQEPADMAQFAEEKDSLAQEARAEAQQRVLRNFIDRLKEKADIKVESLGLAQS
jgi:peptidyl-prolyl cis-trans isomerase D